MIRFEYLIIHPNGLEEVFQDRAKFQAEALRAGRLGRILLRARIRQDKLDRQEAAVKQ